MLKTRANVLRDVGICTNQLVCIFCIYISKTSKTTKSVLLIKKIIQVNRKQLKSIVCIRKVHRYIFYIQPEMFRVLLKNQ